MYQAPTVFILTGLGSAATTSGANGGHDGWPEESLPVEELD